MSKLIDDLLVLKTQVAARFGPDIDAVIRRVENLEQRIDEKNAVIDAKLLIISELRDKVADLQNRVDRLRRKYESTLVRKIGLQFKRQS